MHKKYGDVMTDQINLLPRRYTKITATLGPASSTYETIEALAKAGVNVFRLNFSHGEYETHQNNCESIRKVSANHNIPLSVMADLQGPKLRVGKFVKDKILLKPGQHYRLDLSPEPGDENRAHLPHPEIFAALKKDVKLLIDDGKIVLRVESFGSDFVITTVEEGGYISAAKGVNFPAGKLDLSPLTEKDRKDLDYALSIGVDLVALSFVQDADDIKELKNIVKDRARIVAKIEKPVALEHIDEIIAETDIIMVARGDLGVETSFYEVPVVQKQIIDKCRAASKPVIVATHMLESMISALRPTRAEASDVANAVYDGADAVMLSGESAVGVDPVCAVRTMSDIIISVENDQSFWNVTDLKYPELELPLTINGSVSASAGYLAQVLNAELIVALTHHGTTVNRVCRNRASTKILAVVSDIEMVNQFNVNWGVKPIYLGPIVTFYDAIENVLQYIKDNKILPSGAKIVCLGGTPIGVKDGTNSIQVVEAL